MNLVFKTNKLSNTTIEAVGFDNDYNEDNFEGGIDLKHLFLVTQFKIRLFMTVILSELIIQIMMFH